MSADWHDILRCHVFEAIFIDGLKGVGVDVLTVGVPQFVHRFGEH
jgi:hypothetical protein